MQSKITKKIAYILTLILVMSFVLYIVMYELDPNGDDNGTNGDSDLENWETTPQIDTLDDPRIHIYSGQGGVSEVENGFRLEPALPTVEQIIIRTTNSYQTAHIEFTVEITGIDQIPIGTAIDLFEFTDNDPNGYYTKIRMDSLGRVYNPNSIGYTLPSESASTAKLIMTLDIDYIEKTITYEDRFYLDGILQPWGGGVAGKSYARDQNYFTFQTMFPPPESYMVELLNLIIE